MWKVICIRIMMQRQLLWIFRLATWFLGLLPHHGGLAAQGLVPAIIGPLLILYSGFHKALSKSTTITYSGPRWTMQLAPLSKSLPPSSWVSKCCCLLLAAVKVCTKCSLAKTFFTYYLPKWYPHQNIFWRKRNKIQFRLQITKWNKNCIFLLHKRVYNDKSRWTLTPIKYYKSLTEHLSYTHDDPTWLDFKTTLEFELHL